MFILVQLWPGVYPVLATVSCLSATSSFSSSSLSTGYRVYFVETCKGNETSLRVPCEKIQQPLSRTFRAPKPKKLFPKCA